MDHHEQSPARGACKEHKRFTIGRTGRGWPRSDVPYLRLSGRWLERAGFAIGGSVKVDVNERCLTIELVD